MALINFEMLKSVLARYLIWTLAQMFDSMLTSGYYALDPPSLSLSIVMSLPLFPLGRFPIRLFSKNPSFPEVPGHGGLSHLSKNRSTQATPRHVSKASHDQPDVSLSFIPSRAL